MGSALHRPVRPRIEGAALSAAGIAQLILTVFILLVFLGFLFWGILTKQFRDIEAAKYRIFDDDDHDNDSHKEE
ncbi:MAG: cbb3-type cytochrome oxidase assembly protein [Thermoleophilia bacterium]|nr:cbb3-type cytochrome oxidase assembly protein [Thermoleophilia bacterium]